MDLGLVATMASISGFSLRDIRGLAKDRKRADLLVRTSAKYLAAYDRADDGMLGMWTLQECPHTYEHFGHRYVSGNLAVLYPLEPGTRWQCQMFLEYRAYHSGLPGLAANGGLAHLFSACVTGVYDVVISKMDDGRMNGQSSMVRVRPSRHVMDQGVFENLRLIDGHLIGDFRNTNTQGQGQFIFFMRSRWADVASNTAY